MSTDDPDVKLPDDPSALALAQSLEQKLTEMGHVIEPPEPFESLQDALVQLFEASPARQAKAEQLVQLRRDERSLAIVLSYELNCALFGRTPSPTMGHVDLRRPRVFLLRSLPRRSLHQLRRLISNRRWR
jgi:hypothetical protein